MMRISNIPEKEIRRFIQGYTDMNLQYEFLLDVIREHYNGRFTDLIFALIDGESEDFIKVDESLLAQDYPDKERVEFILTLKENLDKGTDQRTTCVLITRTLSESSIDLNYLSELDKLLEAYCHEVKEIDIYCILRRVLDIFVFDFVDTIDDADEYKETDLFIYMIKNHDNLELVLY